MLLMMPIRGGGRKRQTDNAAAVLVGDFLYSRASQLLARLGSCDKSFIAIIVIARIYGNCCAHRNFSPGSAMTDATNRRELLQLLARRSGNISEEMYFSVIERKTANLFE